MSQSKPAKYALRELGRRIYDLTEQINDADKHLNRLLYAVAPTVLALPQVGPVSAAQLVITAGENIDRFPSEAAFARLLLRDAGGPGEVISTRVAESVIRHVKFFCWVGGGAGRAHRPAHRLLR
ncbi:hypothetical protein QFZ79_002046 [Arthrobacter sp. V4I6]|uniref:hypothetical protein n=1 Tax=unclassified Arthrobacter TaxID=235627 RepID=UPI0027846B49|nr:MULTISPECIES: hypothetical protein [unclassified Arthrobacter]MDQ0819756.1 hypothetical protein [Arthrobacter sp. V1I7]MDQ0853935.1 hypothetical protein [Arthrobacter sp. V4I6]